MTEPKEAETKPKFREWKPSPKAPSNGAAAALTPPTPPAAPKTRATIALDEYATRAAAYLEVSTRYHDLETKLAELAAQLAPAKEAMDKARADLDEELSLLDPEGKPKPFSQRVKVRGAKLQERACETCGATFQPKRCDQRFCSRKCGKSAFEARRKATEPAADVELVEASA